MTKPPGNVLELQLEHCSEMAPKAAVEKVIVVNSRQELPIYIRPVGKVVEMPLEELRERSENIRADRQGKVPSLGEPVFQVQGSNV